MMFGAHVKTSLFLPARLAFSSLLHSSEAACRPGGNAEHAELSLVHGRCLGPRGYGLRVQSTQQGEAAGRCWAGGAAVLLSVAGWHRRPPHSGPRQPVELSCSPSVMWPGHLSPSCLALLSQLPSLPTPVLLRHPWIPKC